MHKQTLCGVAIALCHAWAGLANGGVISSLEMDFASTPGAHLSVDGNNAAFTFTPDNNGYDFQINNVSGGTGSSLGLFGTLSGTCTIGTAVNNEAPVTGNGVLTISDGSQGLTADISFLAIDKMGWLGELNPDLAVNLSNVAYAGTNQDLQDLMVSANGGDAIAVLGFFNGQTLAQLESGGQEVNTAFTGARHDDALPQCLPAGRRLLVCPSAPENCLAALLGRIPGRQ